MRILSSEARQRRRSMMGRIVINACHATYLKRAVGICGIGDSDCDTRLAQQIAVLLAYFVHAEKELCSIPAEPDRAHLWFSFWPNRSDIGECGGLEDIEMVFWND